MNEAEILCGGRYNQFQEQYDKFLKDLTACADVIFFEDGKLMEQKIEVWISRQKNKYNRSMEVIRCFNNEWSIEDVVRKAPLIPRTTYHRDIIENVAKKYGKLIKSGMKDCDTEIAKFALNNPKVLAVLASDTDFLIFEGRWRYFSVKHMNPYTLETMEYNRKSLRRHLRLSDEQLILFSTFNGNDIIEYDKLLNFHDGLIGDGHKLCQIRMIVLANFIRCHTLEDMIRIIAYYVDAESMKLFGESVELYNLNYEDLEEGNELLKFCLSKDFFFVSETLKFSIQTFTINYLDLKDEKLENLPRVHMKLLSKQIGIIMSMSEGDESKNHQLIAKISSDRDYEINKVKAIFPDFSTPSLRELLDRKSFPQHDEIRFKLLTWTISDKLVKIKKIPKNYFLDILVLIFLQENNLLTREEALLVLLTIHAENEKFFEFFTISPDSHLHSRAMQISFIFTRFHLHIQHSLEVTGLKGMMVSQWTSWYEK